MTHRPSETFSTIVELSGSNLNVYIPYPKCPDVIVKCYDADTGDAVGVGISVGEGGCRIEVAAAPEPIRIRVVIIG